MDDEARPRPQDQAADHGQPQPGRQSQMRLQPDSDLSNYKPAGKLAGKAALVTGGDSGIGRAVAVACAMEGADVAVVYHSSDDDAAETGRMVEAQGRRALLLKGDVSRKAECGRFVREAVERFGRLDVLVNNAVFPQVAAAFDEVGEEDLRGTFETNVFGYFFMAQAALPELEKNRGAIVNTSSTTSILGKGGGTPYASTKGAINVFTKSLALEVAGRGVRVNAVVPGPFWTPAIATQDEDTVKNFGTFTMLGRAGQPEEIAPAYVLLASGDGSFITGALLEVSGGFKSVD